MALSEIRFFRPGQDDARSLSGVTPVEVYNEAMAPLFNELESASQVDLDGENAAAAATREAQIEQDIEFSQSRRSRNISFATGVSPSSDFEDPVAAYLAQPEARSRAAEGALPDFAEFGRGGNFGKVDSFEDFIFNSEARRDSSGNLTVFTPPSGDGGGAFEVAGITARYQNKEATRLKHLIESGRPAQAEAEAKAFFRKRAAPFVKHAAQPGLKLQLADTVHHRGEGGLRQILRRATGSSSKSHSALIRQLDRHPDALDRFHQARISYEAERVDRGRRSRKKFREGLGERFKNANIAAKSINS